MCIRDRDIEAANKTKPDFIGFVFAESRRHVSDMDAVRLKEHLGPVIKAVGVFVNDEPEHIAALVRDEVIDIIQLHGGESVHYIETVSYTHLIFRMTWCLRTHLSEILHII